MGNNHTNRDTRFYNEQIINCHTEDEYNMVMSNFDKNCLDWNIYINEKLMLKGISKKDVSNSLNVSYNTASKMLEEVPAKRENLLMLAALVGLSIEETNNALTRFGRYSALYAKDYKDFIWMFILNNGGCDNPRRLHLKYQQEYDEALSEIDPSNLPSGPIPTGYLENLIVNSGEETSFKNIIKGVEIVLDSGYDTLQDYMCAFIDDSIVTVSNNKAFIQKYYYQTEKMSENTPPDRMFLLAFGLNLNLTEQGVNHLLSLAHMAPLCSGECNEFSKLESYIFFLLRMCASSFECNTLGAFEYDKKNRFVKEDGEVFYTPHDYIKYKLKKEYINSELLALL